MSKSKVEKIEFVTAGRIGGIIGVRPETIRKWARAGKIPKLILPNGRFAFDPDEVVRSLGRKGAGSDS